MEGLRKISLLLILVATLHLAATHMMMDPRTGLHIPEKILGVIDIVHSHKNKPGQTPAPYQPGQAPSQAPGQYQPGQNYQYPQWNQPSYQGQAQYQGQYQGQQNQQQAQVQGQNQQYYPQSYPQNNAPVYPTYPTQYPQNGASQGQAQGQYQYQNAGQFQGQNQQANGQYQGQTQQQTQQQTGFQTGQNPYPQTGQFGQNQASGQYGESTGQFQAVQSSGSQSSGFQVTGGQAGNQGPTCVCQAWTKPNATKGEPGPLEKTENAEVNEVPMRM